MDLEQLKSRLAELTWTERLHCAQFLLETLHHSEHPEPLIPHPEELAKPPHVRSIGLTDNLLEKEPRKPRIEQDHDIARSFEHLRKALENRLGPKDR